MTNPPRFHALVTRRPLFLLVACALSAVCIFVALGGAAIGQDSKTRDLKLAGDRFKPLTYDTMTPEQRKMTDDVLAGERASMAGPYNVLLRSPEMGDLAQKFGAYTRFHSTVPKKLNEFAIIITARYWSSQFEWAPHKRAALQAGLSPAVADAIAAGKRPASMQPDEEVVYNFCSELLVTKQVSDPNFAAAVKLLSERGVVDLIGVMGYYQLVSMLLNTDRYPMPNGMSPELKPLPTN
jgi:4-carboxymuconolactone decarboxylase